MPRAFLGSLAAVNAALLVAGAAYAARLSLPPAVAAPIVAAFLLQISFYLAAGFPEVRRWAEQRLRPSQLGALAVGFAVAPYLVYSGPTGMFRWTSLALLAAIAGVPACVYVVWPARKRGLCWQDLVLLALVAAAELGKAFRRIYASPIEDLRIDILGRFMILGVAALSVLSLRRLEGCDYRLGATWKQCRIGIAQAGWFLPFGVAGALVLDFADYRPAPVSPGLLPLLAAGTFLGVYLAVALFEELLFRGILQNLLSASTGRPVVSQLAVCLLAALVHLPFRAFPNWRFAVLAAAAHWFYGQAWRKGGLPAASIAHAAVVTVWRLLFTA